MQYNKKVNTNFNLDDQFYAYYRDIVWNVKKPELRIRKPLEKKMVRAI